MDGRSLKEYRKQRLIRTDFVYKYQPINNESKENLKNKILWSSRPEVFNDPFDMQYLKIGDSNKEGNYYSFFNRLHQHKIVCLTSNPLNTLMWSHYADKHRGMLLGFINESSNCFKVHYTDRFPEVDFNKEPNWLKFTNVLICKSKCWEYEEERRIVCTPELKAHPKYPGRLLMIAFGLRTKEEDINEVISLVNDNSVHFYKCEMRLGFYNLDFKRI